MPMSEFMRRLRAQVGPATLLSVGVVALIRDEVGRVLFQCRVDNGRWGLPGGMVEPGETPADALVREAWEETGLHVAPLRVAGVLGGPDFHTRFENGDELSNITLAFECRAIGGALRPDGIESAELAYVDPAEAPARLALPPVFARVAGALIASGERAYFAPATWQPPADGHRSFGMSDYMRDLRARVGHELLQVAGAAAIILDDAGRVLLQRRGDTGQWGLIGGGMDPDEAPADAVAREAWEETGLLVEPVRLIGVYGGADYYLTYPNGDRVSIVSQMFECRVVGGELSPDGRESLELRYFEPRQVLAAMDFPPRMRERIGHALRAEQAAYFAGPAWTPPPASGDGPQG